MMEPNPTQRPLGELFSELAAETGTLFKKEVALVKVEMRDKASKAGHASAIIAAGGGVAALGAMTLTAAIVLMLATVLPAWLAATLVGVVVATIGGVVLAAGIKALKGIDAAPRETLLTLQQDKNWLKEQVSR